MNSEKSVGKIRSGRTCSHNQESESLWRSEESSDICGDFVESASFADL